MYILLFLIILIVVIYLDIVLRQQEVSKRKIKFYEASVFIVFLLYLMIVSRNYSFLAVIGTTLISFAWVFKELFANFGATIIMQLYPQFEKDDVLDMGEGMEPLVFEEVGFLRSVLKKTNGDLVYAPNRTLLNEVITVS